MLLVLVLTLLPLPPPLDDEPVPPEGAPVDEVVCPVEALGVVCEGWVWPGEVEAAPDCEDEPVDGAAEDGGGLGVGEAVGGCDVGAVEDGHVVELCEELCAAAAVVVVMGACDCAADVVLVASPEDVAGIFAQASEELEPVGEV